MSRKKNTKRKSRKILAMSGCSHSRKRRCALCKHPKGCQCAMCKRQTGGHCAACNNINLMKGGSHPAPIPGPFVGHPWGAFVNQWPGANGIGADRNYLHQNMYLKDPQTMMILGGKRKTGKKYNTRKTKKVNRKKGGGIIPQSLTNLGRSISFNAGSIYNTLNGYASPVNPAPYEQQLPNATKQLLI